MRKTLGPLLGLLVLGGVAVAIYFSASEKVFQSHMVEINGLIGSEKSDFFDDPRVKDRLEELGLVVHYQKAGSRQIGTSYNPVDYDFVFPAGLPAAELIRRQYPQSKSFSPFFSPMAIATWKPIAELLLANNVAKDRGNYYTLDMQVFLKMFEQAVRWKDLPHNAVFSVNKSLLINSTDIRKSNSAAMYLALASYVLNDNNVVQNETQANAILPLLSELFLRQGFSESSSAAPFEDYLLMGMGKAPMVMIYEQQFIQRAALNDGSIQPQMVLIYPEPSLFTKHTVIGFSEGGIRLGKVLESDPRLQELAIEYGLRNSNITYFRNFIKKHKIPVASLLVNVVEPSTFEIMEHMINWIEKKYSS
jgi:hypothetical protein